jgi:hypothetical protein
LARLRSRDGRQVRRRGGSRCHPSIHVQVARIELAQLLQAIPVDGGEHASCRRDEAMLS